MAASANGNGADSNAKIVAAFCRDFGVGAGTIDGPAWLQNRGRGLDRETRDDRLASGDPAEYPARVVGWHTDVVDDGPQTTPVGGRGRMRQIRNGGEDRPHGRRETSDFAQDEPFRNAAHSRIKAGPVPMVKE